MSATFRDSLLENKVAFVSGSSSGICLRIAERMAEAGARVMLHGRNAEKLDAACTAILSSGRTASYATADVRDYEAISRALQQTRDLFGEIDILICGAAGNFPAPVMGMSPNGFKAVVDIDLLGTYNTARAAYPHLRKPGASVISISANHASVPYPMQAHVCAAKAGVERLTQVLALEWGPEGIRANTINPGPIEGTEGMARLAPTEAAKRAVIETVPLRRMGTRDDIANVAIFLCSDAASYITGAVLVCDGGQIHSGSRLFGAPSEAPPAR
ncbi:MAG: SDR family oxidoreductase [Bryobacteraceae bacterium]|nr:SDR family oxidoreductase [Bryobacteraceae bacterium]